MGTDGLREVICRVLCKRLTPPEADEIVNATKAVAIKAGDFLIRQGDDTRGLFLLLTGSADVLRSDDGGAGEDLGTVTAPTVIGEMSLITARHHSASVLARTDCALRLLPKSEFLRLLETGNLAAYKLVATIAEVLAARLLRMDEKVLELSRQRSTPAPVEELAAFKQKLFSEWRF